MMNVFAMRVKASNCVAELVATLTLDGRMKSSDVAPDPRGEYCEKSKFSYLQYVKRVNKKK